MTGKQAHTFLIVTELALGKQTCQFLIVTELAHCNLNMYDRQAGL